MRERLSRREDGPGTGHWAAASCRAWPEPSEWEISSDLLVAAKSGTQRCPEGGNGKQTLLPEVPSLLELGKLSLPGELDGGTSHGVSGRDPAALGTFQGEENELACWVGVGGSVRSVRDPTR